MKYLGNANAVNLLDIEAENERSFWVLQHTERAFEAPKGSSLILLRSMDLETIHCPEIDHWMSQVVAAIEASRPFPVISSTSHPAASVPESASRQWPPISFTEAIKGMEALSTATGKRGEKSFESEFRRLYPDYIFVPATAHRHVVFYMRHKDLIPRFTGSSWNEFRKFVYGEGPLIL